MEGGEAEEFPHFREFWVEMPKPNDDRAIIYALLDSPSVAGAYRFEIYPSKETTIDVTATLFPRQHHHQCRHRAPDLHVFRGRERPQADGRFPARSCTIRTACSCSRARANGSGALCAIRASKTISSFSDNNPRGFGLMQRDRVFEHYQDLEAHLPPAAGLLGRAHRPMGRGPGRAGRDPDGGRDPRQHRGLLAAATGPYEPGQEVVLSYRLRAAAAIGAMHPGGKAINTFQTPPRASGSNAPSDPRHRRFIIDFAGGNLPYYFSAPDQVQLVPSTSAGQITNTFLMPNSHTDGFRAAIDVKLEPGQSTDLRAFLRAGNRTLTETWTYPWFVE